MDARRWQVDFAYLEFLASFTTIPNAFNHCLDATVMDRLKSWTNLPFRWLLPLLFFSVGLTYLYGSPHFEASDTNEHVGVVKWIAERGTLPVQSASHEQMYGQEGSQPPLYYLLMSSIWALLDTSDFDDFYQLNPLVIAGYPERLGNRNYIFYRQPYPPHLSGTSLTLYVIRLLTLGMSTVTVYAVYRSAQAIIPQSVGFAVLATALTAFNPQFLFISTSVSNDNLVTMLASLIIWQTLIMLREGFQTRRSLLLALLGALAALAKLNGLVMLSMVALAGIWLAWRTRDIRGLMTLGGAMLGFWLVIAGWWYLRNFMLYGELFGTATMLDFYGRRHTALQTLLLEEFEGFRISYWGLFGGFSILTHETHYRMMDALGLVSAAGLPVFLAKNRKKPLALTAFGFLGILIAIGSAMLFWWTLQTTASTGRLLFPYIASISILMAMGLSALRIPTLLIALPMMAFSLIAPFAYIMPEYDHPPQVDRLPASAVQTFAQWEDITLIGYKIPPPQRWSAGDEIPMTLYWRPLAASERLQAFFISLIDSQGAALATLDSFPGWGTLPTTWWQADTIYRDDYVLQIPGDADGFDAVQLHIGWYDWTDRSNIRPVLENGEKAAAYTIPIGAYASSHNKQGLPSDSIPNGTVFGDAIQLNRFRFTEGSRLELEWQLLHPLAGDWRVFAVVMSEPYQHDNIFEILLQKDAAPAVPVGYLKAGEILQTIHKFDLPDGFSGDYGIYVGWYNDETGERLAAPYPANMLLLEDIAFSG